MNLVAFTGSTGSGVTTACNLFCNLYKGGAMTVSVDEMIHEAAAMFCAYNMKPSTEYKQLVVDVFSTTLRHDGNRDIWNEVLFDNLEYFLLKGMKDGEVFIIDGLVKSTDIERFKAIGGIVIGVQTKPETIQGRGGYPYLTPAFTPVDITIENDGSLLDLENELKEAKEAVTVLKAAFSVRH